jgi:hypothetical protein
MDSLTPEPDDKPVPSSSSTNTSSRGDDSTTAEQYDIVKATQVLK